MKQINLLENLNVQYIDSNRMRTHNHLVRKRTLKHLAK